MTKEDYSLDSHLCFTIYGAHLALKRAYKPLMDALGLTYPQYLALSLLWEQDGRSVGAMSAALDLEPSTMTPLLKRLEEAGFVVRQRVPSNERQVRVSLTDKGRAARGDGKRLMNKLQDVTGLPYEELSQLNKQMQDLRAAVRASLADKGS
ncbi:MAG: MarR family transcriptional regulator [Pseudomonadota bacterium]